MTLAIVAEDESTLRHRRAGVDERTGENPFPPELRAQLAAASLVGTPDHMVERLQELEAAGVERVLLQHLVHEDLETISLIGREVIPRVS